MFICLIIVCIRVYLKDREMAILLKNWSDEDPAGSIRLRRDIFRFNNGVEVSIEEIRQQVKDQYRDTRVIVSQTMVYFSAYIILDVSDGDLFNAKNLYQERASAITLGLGQGFFQLLIFVFHQVFNQRRHDPNVTIFDAIREIFRGESGNETFILTRMHAVIIAPRQYEDSYYGDQTRLENEARPLLSSFGASANFGSASSLPTNGRSLMSFSWLMDGNSNVQQSRTSENGNENQIAASSTSLSEEGVSIQQSLGGFEDYIEDNISAVSSSSSLF